MDNDATMFNQPTCPRLLLRHAVLWDELARLHAQLGIDPPTATYDVEELAEEVALARRATQQPAVEGQADFDSMPFNAPLEGGDHGIRQRSQSTSITSYISFC